MNNLEILIEEFESQIKSWKEEVGEIPENTCPSLDKVIKDIENYVNEIEYLKKNSHKYDNILEFANDFPYFGWNNPIYDIDNQLRKDNEKLRELGMFWYEKCKEIKSFISKAYNQAHEAGRQEALQEADKLIGQAHSDGFNEGKQEAKEN